MPINDTDEVLHRIRVTLHKSNLPNAKGAYYSRTDSETGLSIEDVAASAINRGGVTGSHREFSLHAREFFDELAYLLCDGFAVNTGYFSMYPAVKKLFKTKHEARDSKNHEITFRFRVRPPLRRLAGFITIEVEDNAKARGRIEQFTDETGAVNETVTSGALFSLAGRKIKIAGDNPDCGVWFASKADSSLRFKAARKLTVNTSTKLSGIAPALPDGEYTVEVKTQYTVGGINLKKPWTLKSGFTVKAGD
jgi:hypothetical protein